METNEKTGITGNSVFLTLIISIFVAMGIYVMVSTNKLNNEYKCGTRCHYRYNTEVMMSDGMCVTFISELEYDYNSVSSEKVEVSRIISDMVLKKEMCNNTVEDLISRNSCDIEDVVNAIIKENNIDCKWHCSSFFFAQSKNVQ